MSEPIEVRVPEPNDPARDLLAAVRDRLDQHRSLPLRDIAFDARIEPDVLRRLFTAAGRLRDDDRYGELDRRYAQDVGVLLQRFDVAMLERVLRLHARSATTIVVNQLALLRNEPQLGELLDGGTEVAPELAEVVLAEAERLLPLTQRLLVADHHQALLSLLDSDAVREASRSTGESVDLAVGFVDLVGFTRLSASVDPAGVGTVLGGFEDAVHRAADAVGDVLVVKFIGDAAMLVSESLDRLVDVLLRVVDEPLASGDEVERRAGAAAGEITIRDGDYVGTSVNTAARLTDLARPGSVLVAEEAVARLERDWQLRQLRARKLKGLGRSRPSRVLRPDRAER